MPDRPTVADIDKAPETLPAARPPGAPVDALEELEARFAEVADENFNLQSENRALKDELGRKVLLEDMLNPTARRAFVFLCVYGILALILLLMDGFHWRDFDLEPAVIGVIVGSTAVSAIGLFGLVIKGMFEAMKR